MFANNSYSNLLIFVATVVIIFLSCQRLHLLMCQFATATSDTDILNTVSSWNMFW